MAFRGAGLNRAHLRASWRNPTSAASVGRFPRGYRMPAKRAPTYIHAAVRSLVPMVQSQSLLQYLYMGGDVRAVRKTDSNACCSQQTPGTCPPFFSPPGRGLAIAMQQSRATVYRAPVALLHTTDRKQEQSSKVRATHRRRFGATKCPSRYVCCTRQQPAVAGLMYRRTRVGEQIR